MLTQSNTLFEASSQWAKRPDDQRFTSIDELLAFTTDQRTRSKATKISNRRLEARPVIDESERVRGICIVGPDEVPAVPSHW